MRREVILVLIGIISMSSLSTFLSGFVQINNDKVLLDTVLGAVGAGNFSYWQLEHTGPLLVELTSLSGDADLYVSDTIRPSFEIDKNNFSSITCGHDYVAIPSEFPRPIGIGVFGHWSASLSEYSIQVFLDTSSGLQYAHVQLFQHGQASRRHDIDKNSRDATARAAPRKQDDENKPRFLKLVNILDMIFEMFVL